MPDLTNAVAVPLTDADFQRMREEWRARPRFAGRMSMVYKQYPPGYQWPPFPYPWQDDEEDANA